MATHSSVLVWRIPGMEEPGGLPSMGSHRVGHDCSDLAAAAAGPPEHSYWVDHYIKQSYHRAGYNVKKLNITILNHFPFNENFWKRHPQRAQHSIRQGVGHWATSLSLFTFTHFRRKWQPTPVFLPGESQGWRSLVGCHLWDRTKSDMTEEI